ncbi:hypothetical protein [Gorillibacterium massiliense]|uniref:hypothetical protein n=1 Tax=Gorillibacterium massiliense TaxID=1280390 RepID=UPI0004B2E09E|nr:hypothetical protein [Gorillibacterium massiliense]
MKKGEKKQSRMWVLLAVGIIVLGCIAVLSFTGLPFEQAAAHFLTGSSSSPQHTAANASTTHAISTPSVAESTNGVNGGSPSPSPALTQAPSSTPTATPSPQKMVAYHGPVEHIFFHPLIAYPELAFDGDSMTKGYDDWFVTIPEFNKIIDSLYRNNYILIPIDSIYETKTIDGKMTATRKDLTLPEGKKPLILSIDDNNYYDYMRKNGNINKLVLDENGEVAGYAIDPKGAEVTARDNDIIPILDDFVKAHPDFSFQGAKGVIALTGYEGILGYRTNETGAADYAETKAAALKVVSRLKETGWTFASHGWGHKDAGKISEKVLFADTDRWLKEVGSLLGPTPVYIYPYGASVPEGSPKMKGLQDRGFAVFCSVGPAPYLKASSGVVMMDRRHIDGLSLNDDVKRLAPLFDATVVIDPIRPSVKAKLATANK